MNRIQSTFTSWREYLASAPQESTFSETGEITPEEFVRAGDYLVYRFPTWQWQGSDEGRQRDLLPPDKQFLITRNVPSHARAADVTGHDMKESTEEDGDWMVETSQGKSNRTTGAMEMIEDIPDEDSTMDTQPPPQLPPPSASTDLDMDSMALPDDEDEDVNRNLVSTRTYNLYITYDKYYHTPRLWLSGFTETGLPLTPSEVLQDVDSDYADKTVTWETFPHYAQRSAQNQATVHPCRHASVMRLFITRMNAANARKGVELIRVDQYIVIFLKFMASVLPTINHGPYHDDLETTL